ncbi:hypothetical protein UJ101_02236 [Flavobacteriaceae bacterium UJ101]|nr:hypothetical protein UJ101_02236 [Flavobacteriaceae bacterium UJ101]
MRKLIYIGITIIVLLMVFVLMGKKSVHHEIIIDATSDQVWEVLINMEKYPEWNPVMQLLEGEVKEGNKVKYQFTQDENNISEIRAIVKQVIPNKLLNQKGGVPLVLTFNHKYILEPNEGQTKLMIHEDYRGIGVNFWNPKPVEQAYKRLNKALKLRTEKIYK